MDNPYEQGSTTAVGLARTTTLGTMIGDVDILRDHLQWAIDGSPRLLEKATEDGLATAGPMFEYVPADRRY